MTDEIGCIGKFSFPDKAAANRVLATRQRRMKKIHAAFRGRLTAYKCTVCGHWHHGTVFLRK